MVKIDYHDDGTASKLKVVEAFTSFIKVENSSAIGLHKLITNSIQQKGLDIKNCRGQVYDCAAVMRGKYSGFQKKIQDVAPHAYYVRCASHNLNLELKDAMEAVTETYQFYDTIESVYNFFRHNIVRWQKLLKKVHDRYCSNPTLKALNPTRWFGRYDAVYALKERFCDVMKCLIHIRLTNTKPKEKNEAMAIKKQIENFDFVCMLVMRCKILQIVSIPLKAMQYKTIDLISAHKLLQTAVEDIAQLRRSSDAVLNEASTIASTSRLPRQFLNKRAKKTKAYFDEIFEGITLSNPKKRFCITVFLPMMNILFCQLINRFDGMKSVVTSYQVLEPSFLSNASHLDFEVEARTSSNKFSDNVSPLFPNQMLSIKISLEKILPKI